MFHRPTLMHLSIALAASDQKQLLDFSGYAFEQNMSDQPAKIDLQEHGIEPVDGLRLIHASRRFGKRGAEVVPQMQKLSRPREARVAIKVKGRILIINPAEVVAVEADGNYVVLQLVSGFHSLRESLSVVAEKFKPYGFIRIHRSVLVNTVFVEEISPQLTGEYGLRVKGGKEFTVSRTYKQNLRFVADVWIGSDSFLAE
jgi:two-component system LytT family response regulator